MYIAPSEVDRDRSDAAIPINNNFLKAEHTILPSATFNIHIWVKAAHEDSNTIQCTRLKRVCEIININRHGLVTFTYSGAYRRIQ